MQKYGRQFDGAAARRTHDGCMTGALTRAEKLVRMFDPNPKNLDLARKTRQAARIAPIRGADFSGGKD